MTGYSFPRCWAAILPTEKCQPTPAAQVDLALDRLKTVVEAAGLTLSNMVFVNPYLTSEIPMRIMNEHYARRFEFGNTPGRATIEVSSLPEGAHIAYTGVAVRDLSQRRAIRPEEYAAKSHRKSVCLRRRHTLLFREERIHSRAQRRRVSRPRLRIRFARPCETCSTTWKRRT